MALANCPRCGNLFDNSFRDICQNCAKFEEKQFDDVREYLRENRKSTIYEASEATEVPVSQITKFIQQGRLKTQNMPNILYPCDTCGAEISSGRFCQACSNELSKGFAEVTRKPEPESKRLREGDNKSGYHFDEFKKRK